MHLFYSAAACSKFTNFAILAKSTMLPFGLSIKVVIAFGLDLQCWTMGLQCGPLGYVYCCNQLHLHWLIFESRNKHR